MLLKTAFFRLIHPKNDIILRVIKRTRLFDMSFLPALQCRTGQRYIDLHPLKQRSHTLFFVGCFGHMHLYEFLYL